MGLDGDVSMAKISFEAQEEFFAKLRQLEEAFASDESLERAVAAGASVVADAIRDKLEALPEDNFRFLPDGEKFDGLPEQQKQDLLDSFGLTPIDRDKSGFVHTKAGFDGYGSHPTRQYPYGVPNQMVARAVESGSSVRKKTPFVRPAVKASQDEAVKAMEEVIDNEIKNII